MRDFLAKLLGPFNKFLDNQVAAGKAERQTNQVPQDNKSPFEVVADYQKKRNTQRNIFVAIGLILVLVFALSSNTNNGGTGSNYEAETAPDTSWIPAAFNQFSGNPEIAWRWLESKEYKCSYGDFCEGIMVIAKNGCANSLYAEISLLDKNDVQIGYTNDTLSSALPMQESKMVFNIMDEEASQVRISKISCY
jgi:hypothetical protein